jgi:hypothetical protein
VQMLTISVDNYTTAVRIVNDFDKLTSIHGIYRPIGHANLLMKQLSSLSGSASLGKCLPVKVHRT